MNQFFRFSILAISFAALLFSGCKTTGNLSTKEVKLRFTPQKGDEYTMSMNMNMLMSGPQSMNMNMQMDNGLKVSEIANDGSFFLDNMVAKVGMTMNNGGMAVDYDSENPKTDDPATKAIHETMGTLINKSMKSKLSNRGEILESPDYGEIFGDDPQLAGSIDQMDQSLKGAFITYPEKMLVVGDSWNASVDVKGQAPMTQNFTYTVKEITTTTVTLAVTGTIKFSPEAMVGGSGDFGGQMIINRANGFLKTSTLKQNLNMSVMGMDMKATTDVSLTMVKK
jgi:hypothetical protein